MAKKAQAFECPRCRQVVTDTVKAGRFTFCASCFRGWVELNAERIVAEVPPVATDDPAPVAVVDDVAE